MRHEIKLSIPRGKSRAMNVRGGGFRFCLAAFLKVVTGVPESASTCYLVFTEEETADSYRITQPRSRHKLVEIGGSWVSESYLASNFIDISGFWIYISVRVQLAKLYKKGYRYAHIEYDES